MNKNIKLVQKWLNDPDSVSMEELEKNREEARVAAWDIATAAFRAADMATWAAKNVEFAANPSAKPSEQPSEPPTARDIARHISGVRHAVKRYMELSGEVEQVEQSSERYTLEELVEQSIEETA